MLQPGLLSVDLSWSEGLGLGIVLAAGFIGRGVEPRLRDALRRRLEARRRVLSLKRREEAAAETSTLEVYVDESGVEKVLVNLARDPIRGPRVYASSLRVSDFRCFDEISVSLRHPGDTSDLTHQNVNLILGDNGSGKSTLLKAIAIAALGPILDSSGFVPFHLIRSGCKGSLIRGTFLVDEPRSAPEELVGEVEVVRYGDYEELRAGHDRGAWRALSDDSDPGFLVVGYGVNRRVAEDEAEHAFLERSRRRRRYQRVASLFDEGAVLTPLDPWLPTLDYRRRGEVEELLAALLPEEARLKSGKAGEAVFEWRGQELPYLALSDGYRSFIGWVGDLLVQIDAASQGRLPLNEVGGIVLVDEVDLLLHPSWQREVVPNIARTFPELQFVFTTHSPIVAGTLESDNILIARTNEEGSSRLDRIDASIHGLNAEQILLSSYFELESTRAPGVQSELGKLAEQAMAGDDEAALTYLRALSGKSTHLDS
ncbi:MAG TPA: AAA family ATPase [Solirubrobacterales bacterium]|nr:AAA family ATPase [Solirubrobacterales bacterium]